MLGIDEQLAFYRGARMHSAMQMATLASAEHKNGMIQFRMRLMLGWPIWALRWILLRLRTVGRKTAAWKAQWTYIQRFWRWYFAQRECSFYTTRDLGESTEGRLLLAIRTHFMDGPFLIQALDVPVVMPIQPGLSQFRLLRWLPFPNFYRQLKPVAMDDVGTDAHYHNICRLIERGYTVLAFISPEITDRRLDQCLAFETQIMPLIRQVKNVQLVDHKEFSGYPLCTPADPKIIRVRITPLDDIVDREGHADHHVVNRIATWFGFRFGSVIRRRG